MQSTEQKSEDVLKSGILSTVVELGKPQKKSSSLNGRAIKRD